MTPTQREAALRLADWLHASGVVNSEVKETIALLRELLAEPQGEPVAWHVCSVNSDGALSLEFAAPWEELAHEHINDAINEHDIDGATSWVVRPVYASPQPQQPQGEPVACQYAQDVEMPEYRCVMKCQYAAPQQRKPLSDEQVWKDDAIMECNAHIGAHMAELLRLVRAIERAHDITGEAP